MDELVDNLHRAIIFNKTNTINSIYCYLNNERIVIKFLDNYITSVDRLNEILTLGISKYVLRESIGIQDIIYTYNLNIPLPNLLEESSVYKKYKNTSNSEIWSIARNMSIIDDIYIIDIRRSTYLYLIYMNLNPGNLLIEHEFFRYLSTIEYKNVLSYTCNINTFLISKFIYFQYKHHKISISVIYELIHDDDYYFLVEDVIKLLLRDVINNANTDYNINDIEKLITLYSVITPIYLGDVVMSVANEYWIEWLLDHKNAFHIDIEEMILDAYNINKLDILLDIMKEREINLIGLLLCMTNESYNEVINTIISKVGITRVINMYNANYGNITFKEYIRKSILNQI